MASSISERCGLVAAVLVELAVVTSALAQPAPEPTLREAARAKLVEGVAALKRGDHGAALARFEEGYALVPSPKIFYDFGLAYLGLGRRGEALSAFERFLAGAPDAAADKRAMAADQVAALRPRVGAVIIKGLPAGATIVVDDREVGTVPLAGPLYLDPGPHEIIARLSPGVTSPVERLEVTPGSSLAVTFASPSYARPPPAVRPPANGSPVARVDLVPGETHAHARRVAAIASGAAGLALIAAGVTFGVLARREGDSLTRDSENGTATPTPFDPSKESRGTTYATLQAIGLGAGALGLAVGVVLYSTTRGQVSAEPLAARSVVGANLRVGF
jgi:hypothetical protein